MLPGKELKDGGRIYINPDGGKYFIVVRDGNELYQWDDSFDSYHNANEVRNELEKKAGTMGLPELISIFEGSGSFKKMNDPFSVESKKKFLADPPYSRLRTVRISMFLRAPVCGE